MSVIPQRKEITLKWRAQPKQLRFLRACGLAHPFDGGTQKKPVAKIIGYGGAAGGGKSDALIMAAIIYCLTYHRSRVMYFRRHFVQLEGPGGAIMRSEELLTGIAKFNAQKRRWTFPNGSIIQFAYLDSDDDVHNYHSQQLDVIMFDEASQFTWYQVSYMQSRIRSVKGYPTFTAMATNPGGPGSSWFKANFVKAGPPELPVEVEVEPGRFRTHIFIPATLSDNQILERMDPGYRQNLENLPEHLRRQLLEGDWDSAEGAAFPEFRQSVHVIPPFAIPDEWIKFRSLDWGYAKPYCVGWYAVDHDGRMYKYRELYGWGGRDDVGSKEDPEDVAEKIIRLEQDEHITYAVADSAIFGGRQDNYPTVAEQFATAFGSRALHWQPITKGPGSRIAGKLEIHHRLKYSETEEPMLLFFNNCRHTIRTFPNMILHDTNPEDVDSDLEDHCFVAGTLVETERGQVPIEQITLDDKVMTRKGFKRVINCGPTQEKAKVFTVVFSNGETITGTGNHPVWVTGKSFTPIDELRSGDMIEVSQNWRNLTCQNGSLTTGSFIEDTLNRRADPTGTISNVPTINSRRLNTFIKKSGWIISEKFPKVITFTIRMKIRPIMKLKIWNVSHTSTTFPTMEKNRVQGKNTWPLFVRLHRLGIVRQRVLRGIRTMLQIEFGANIGSRLKSFVNTAVNRLIAFPYALPIGFAAISANRHGDEKAEWMISNDHAVYAAVHSPQTSTPKSRLAPQNVPHVLSVLREPNRVTVYNLTVQDAPEYYANGVLVHNCYDETRYSCLSRPIIPKRPGDKLTDIQKHKRKTAADKKRRNNIYRII